MRVIRGRLHRWEMQRVRRGAGDTHRGEIGIDVSRSRGVERGCGEP